MDRLLHRLRTRLSYAWFRMTVGSRLASLGRRSFLHPPYRIDGAEGIAIGDDAVMQRGAWLYCVGQGGKPAELHVGRGCVLGYNNHITAVASVRIGEDVLTANNVYISDNVHGYEDITRPVMHQPVLARGPVAIGDGTWLGENVAVIGASVGRNCVIGANAVVTRSIPDYCVAVGIPARVIRHYDAAEGRWRDGPRP